MPAASIADWLDAHHPLAKDEWVKLFRNTFRFTGGEIVGEFLMSLGYLPGAHEKTCPVYKQVLALDPPWRSAAPSRATAAKTAVVLKRKGKK
jgi:DNA-3-methyladenine glycosylase I